MNYQTYLLVGKTNFAAIKEEISKSIPEIANIHPTKIHTFSRDPEKLSIGIKEIREISSINALKSSTLRLIVIEEAEKLTKEAQNAILKTIEESSSNTLVLLLAYSADSILQTIKSRCRIIEVGHTKEINPLVTEFMEFTDAPDAEKIISKILKQDNKRFIVEKIIDALLLKESMQLQSGNRSNEGDMVELLKKAAKGIHNNVSAKLVLETIMINLLLNNS